MSFPYVCSACSAAIRDHVVLECDRRHFHPACLKCQMCGRTPSTADQKLYSFNGLLLCKDDYDRMRSACHVCRQRIEPQDYRFQTFGSRSVHMSCMSCASCRTTLERGDKYVVTHDQRLLCHKCHPGAPGGGGPAAGGRRGRKRANH